MIKKIGVLTSGGDCPGMNNAIAGVVKAAHAKNIQVVGIKDGFKGLVNGWFLELNEEIILNNIAKGGTLLGSARLPEFKELQIRQQAVANLQSQAIEALVVIGGDGSYMGAQKLTEMGINCVGLPGTIDNDIVSSDFTIGFDTALNTVVQAIDKVRDTMTSHNRAAVVEVMGNACGDLVTYAAVGTQAEIFSPSEAPLTAQDICDQATHLAKLNHRSVIILVSEKQFDATALAKKVEQASGYVTRATVLGHIQRGGAPSAMDRYLAFTAAVFAVEKLIAGEGGLYIGLDNNQLVARDIDSTLKMPKPDKTEWINKLRILNAKMTK